MDVMHYTATISKLGPKTIIAVPFIPNEVWGVKLRHHITGSVNGFQIRGPIGADGSLFFLVLGDAWRRDTHLEVGDIVNVELTPEGPQSEFLPPDIASALDVEPLARTFFEGLATFYRKKYLKWIEGARKPEMRNARIQEMVSLLRQGKKQR